MIHITIPMKDWEISTLEDLKKELSVFLSKFHPGVPFEVSFGPQFRVKGIPPEEIRGFLDEEDSL